MMKLKVCAAALVTAASLGMGCRRGPNTEENLRKALDQANMQQVSVNVDDDEHIVHLRGTVNSMADRSRA
jgi:predicted nucleotide-binding protein (sugar kinase/HSP70/actin superfamily)